MAVPPEHAVVGVVPTCVVTVYVVVQLCPEITDEVAPLMKPA